SGASNLHGDGASNLKDNNRYGTPCCNKSSKHFKENVSIPHRYGTPYDLKPILQLPILSQFLIGMVLLL
ncbi:MAG: hypothetical protein ACLURI_11495, partial [Roseburia inulinivorans]